MKKENKLLRIRPFNMANFSSGAGMFTFFAMMGAVFTLPLNFFIWCGLALSMEKTDGKLDHIIFKQRANKIFLPIAIVGFCVLFLLYGLSGGFDFLFASVFAAAFPTIGVYIVARLIASVLEAFNNLTPVKFLVSLFIAGMPLFIAGSFVSAILSEAGTIIPLLTFIIIGIFVFFASKLK